MAISIPLALTVLLSFPYLSAVYRMTETSTKYRFTVDDDSQLSERDAVELSRLALVKHDKKLNRIRPVPFSHIGPSVYAANSAKPNCGYVLWSANSSHREWDYMVQITKSGNDVVCEITKPK